MHRVITAIFIIFDATALVRGEAISGTVIDRQSRRPVSSAEVRIHKAGDPILLADLDTDSAGQFQGPDVAPGEYTVEVLKPNFMPATLRVKHGGAVQVAITRYGVIGGRVTGATGEPLAAVPIMVLTVQPDGSLRRGDAGIFQTDARGQYRIFNLTPGRYQLAALFDATQGGSGVQVFPSSASPQVFSIASGEEFRDINFTRTPQPLFTVSGTLDAALKSSFFGVTLIAREHPWMSVAHIRSAGDGSFRLEGIPAGAYDLVLAGPSNAYGARMVLVGANPQFARMHVDVVAQDVDLGVVAVQPGRTLAVNVEGAPAVCAGGEVALVAVEDLGVQNPAPAKAALKETASIAGIAPGRYAVQFSNPLNECFQTAPVTVDLAGASPGSPVILHVEKAGGISGRLTGAANPAGYEISLLELANRNATLDAVTPAADAVFAFPKLPPGRYRLTVSSRSSAQASTSMDVNVPAGRVLTLDVSAPATEIPKP